MSALFDHLKRLFDEGHGTELPGLRTDAMFTRPGEAIRPAAVLIAVTDRAEPGMLLTHRPHDMRQHAGQVAFPGGKLDPGEDAIAAALREAHEELALDPHAVSVIGTSDRFVTGTGYDITPVLGLVPPNQQLAPNPLEVEEWFEAPLRFLLDPANQIEKEATYGGHHRRYIEIDWQGHHIWGITAAILANLTRRLAWREMAE
jgi:8-oxo-dGTP pyrophosphatase MutT (NUDIX family)